jgi:hypothetical protein
MANPVVTLKQPTTYEQMLNYLLPTKQTVAMFRGVRRPKAISPIRLSN